MNPLLAVVAMSALAQLPLARAQQQQQQTGAEGESNRSALQVQPGAEAIKEKDLYDRSGYLHPFRRMPKFFLSDQRKIWTSPFHTSRQDAKWWAIFGGATAALISTDKYVSKNAPNNPTLNTMGTDTSHLGEP